MIHTEVSEVIGAPREKVFAISTKSEIWPKIYPHIKSVRRLREQYGEISLELDSVRGGLITLVQRKRAPEKVVEDMKNHKVRGKSSYTFESLPEGTRVTLSFDLEMIGLYKLLAPFAKGYIKKQLMALVLSPLKKAAEEDYLREDLLTGGGTQPLVQIES